MREGTCRSRDGVEKEETSEGLSFDFGYKKIAAMRYIEHPTKERVLSTRSILR